MKKHKMRLMLGSSVILTSSMLVGFVWYQQDVTSKSQLAFSTEPTTLMTEESKTEKSINTKAKNVSTETEDIRLEAGVSLAMALGMEETPVKANITLEDKYGAEHIATYQAKVAEDEAVIEQLMIADVTDYINIRNVPNIEGEIVGKLYQNSVGTLLAIEEDWYLISSGTVEGYVKAEYVLTGEDASIRAEEVGVRLAKVNTTTLKVREEPSVEAKVITLVPDGDILAVLEATDEWVKVATEEGDGYVSLEYVDTYTKNVEAESIEEEKERLAKEEEAKEIVRAQAAAAEKARIEAQKKAEAEKKQASATTKTENKKQESTQNNEAKQETTTNTTGQASGESNKQESTQTNSNLGQQIVNYALQFVGNPYVYGGTDLTNGIDCSGYVMRVYEHFGISLPRTSGEQGASGRNVSGLANAQAGDLIWYSGHIGIYMGDGRVVHASNAKEGIKISQANYRTILGIRRII